jgi:hypothetical protein
MVRVIRITLYHALRQARAYLVGHYNMLVRPVEFGKAILPGDTSQYFRSVGSISLSVALCAIVTKLPQPMQLVPMASTSQVLFTFFILAIVGGTLLALLFWYGGIRTHRLQTAVTFWLNWWSCILFPGAIYLAILSVISSRPGLYRWSAILGLIPVMYSLYLLPYIWIKGMTLNGQLRRRTGGAYVAFWVTLFFIFSQAEDWPIREYLAPFFHYVP